ncbi:MAG: FMN-binding protein [Oscillospiraceae bacterium]
MNKNTYSEYVKPVLILTLICFVVSAALALTNAKTAPIIKAEKLRLATEQRAQMFPEAAEFEEIKTDREGVESIYSVDGDKGYVIEVMGNGYKGKIKVTVGIDKEGKIVGITADASGESARVGSKVGEEAYLSKYKEIGEQEVGEVSIISGATLSCKGVNGAVKTAFEVYKELAGVTK